MSLSPSRGDSIAKASQEATAVLSALSNNFESSPTFRYDDETARLETWIGQHDIRNGSLDHKLREASQLRTRVLSLLTDLREVASHSVAPSTTAPEPDDAGKSSKPDENRSIGVQKHKAGPKVLTQDDQSVGSAFSIDTNITLSDSLPDVPVTHIHDLVTLLFELGPSLLDPTPNERFERAPHPDAAQYDISHARDRFPRAGGDLAERLGRENWRRRQSLRDQRQRQDDSLVQKFGADQPGSRDMELSLSVPVSDTDDSDQQGSMDEIAASSGSHSISNDSEGDPFHMESRSFTATASTQAGFQFSVEETQSTAPTVPSKGVGHVGHAPQAVATRYRIPPPPSPNEDYSGQTFLCQFCSHWVSDIKRASDWTKHVFGDLEPYMCTYSDCMQSSKTFGSRKGWWQHQVERHLTRRAWVCTPCEQESRKSVFDSSSSFDEHFDTHEVKLTSTQRQGIRDHCQREVGKDQPDSTCPLCQETITPRRKTRRSRALESSVRQHVADHLEQLALFVAVPAGQMLVKEDDSEFQDDSDSEDGLRSEIESVVSKNTHLSKKEIQLANIQDFIADQERVTNGASTSAPALAIRKRQQNTIVTQNHRQHTGQTQDIDSEAPSFPLHIQVPPPNQHFYSRQGLPSKVNEGLHSSGLICVLNGKGGVGKTLAAVEYIHKYKDQYDAIIWLPADTTPGLTDSCLQMTMGLGIASSTEDHHRVMSKARSWLQETDKRWLLVFDNTLSWTEISKYLPISLQHSKGSVLITTQNDDLLKQAENVTHVRVNPLSRKAGEEMLLHYLGRDVKHDPEKHLANEISAFVSGLPVAIAQIAGYVSYSHYTLEELIETFRQWRRRTGVATDEADDLPAAFIEASSSYEGTLLMVWEITLRDLTQDARDVLNVFAYLNCAAVPRDMLWSMHDDDVLHFLDTREAIRMRRVNDSLIKRRLVDETDGVFSIHRSLQRGLREKLSQDKSKQQAVFEQAVALVREVFPRGDGLQQPMPEKWAECQRLLPHLHALHSVYEARKVDIKGSLDFAQLLLDAGMDQFERGITHEGLLLLNTAENVLGANNTTLSEGSQVMRADIHAMIGIMYDDLGIDKRREAFWRREKALEIRKRTFEEAKTKTRKDEILVYNSEMEYAISLLHYHRYAEAEPIIERCLVKFKEWGSEEEIPFEYAKYYNKIALVRMYQGRLDEAIPLAAKGVQLMEKTGYSLFSSRFRFDMACMILQRGDLEEALRVHKAVYDQRLETVGPENQLSLHSMYAIGAIHELEGRLEEAEMWFRRVIERRRSFSSWPDEAFARAQFHLAKVLLAQGKDEEVEQAKRLQDQALAVLYDRLPLDRADRPPELKHVTDEYILFDHMLPVSPGGPRFTGQGLLECFRRSD